MSNETSKCENCIYYELAPVAGRDPKAFGECHKYALRWSPQFAVAMEKDSQLKYLDNGWPRVKNNSWCGEFKPKTI